MLSAYNMTENTRHFPDLPVEAAMNGLAAASVIPGPAPRHNGTPPPLTILSLCFCHSNLLLLLPLEHSGRLVHCRAGARQGHYGRLEADSAEGTLANLELPTNLVRPYTTASFSIVGNPGGAGASTHPAS